MTYAEIQTRVQNRVIDLPPTVLADIPYLINEAIRSAQRRYNFRAMESTTVMVTTAGSLTPTPNTIANFKEYRDKGPYLLRNLVKATREIVALTPDAALAVLNDSTLPTVPEMVISSVDAGTGVVSFTVAPYPDNLSDWVDGNYRIVVPAYVYSAKLVNAGDTNWFVDNMDDYIYREATGQAFALDWDYNSMAVWLQEADKKFKEAVKADKMQRLAGVDALVPMWQGANQPQIRR